MRLTTPALILSLLFATACCAKPAPQETPAEPRGEPATVAADEAPDDPHPDLAENLKRPESPPLARRTTYKTHPADTEGTLLKEEFFDEAGNLVKIVTYDYYGSGTVDGTTVRRYDERGNCIEDDNGSMVTRSSYDDQDRLIEESWTRGSAGSREEHIRDERGNVVEIKYYDADGTYDFSRIWEFVYDDAGHVVEERKWERTDGGTNNRLMFDARRTFDAEGRLLEERFVEADGSFRRAKRHRYDRRGNLVEVQEFDDDPDTLTDKVVYHVNEYGETVRSESYSCQGADACGEPWSTSVHQYDEYGNKLGYMLEQKHDAGFGERIVLEFREAAAAVTP